MVDQNDQVATSIDIVYYDGIQQKVVFSVKAFGGRPIPNFQWNIYGHNLDLNKNFTIMTFQIPSQYDFIEDYQSAIRFQVDNILMESLSSYGIDTTPFGGYFWFPIECCVEQRNNDQIFTRTCIKMQIIIRQGTVTFDELK